MNLHPWYHKVLVKDPPVNPQRPSGLYLPVDAGEVGIGVVIEHRTDGREPLEPGSVVFYKKGAGILLHHDGEDYRIIDQTCIIAWEEA